MSHTLNRTAGATSVMIGEDRTLNAASAWKIGLKLSSPPPIKLGLKLTMLKHAVLSILRVGRAIFLDRNLPRCPVGLRAHNPVYGADTDHRDPNQWEFYVVSASALAENQRTIGLSKIKRLTDSVKIAGLAAKCKVARSPNF